MAATRVLLVSDLHLECDGDHGARFIARLPRDTADVVVLAGDIIPQGTHNAAWVLGKLCAYFVPTPVLLVAGNHCYWHGRLEDWAPTMSVNKPANLTILQDDVTVINGQRFVGSTLWYCHRTEPQDLFWSDYKRIKNHAEDVYPAALKSRAFLDKNLQQSDVLITHMLPAWACVSPRYENNPDNKYYVHNILPLIEDRKPAVALFGHTHDSRDFVLGATRFVCNPRGYRDENPDFDATKIIEVGR